MKENKIPDLTEIQKRILNDFISEFLPPTGNKRKYTTIEINNLRHVLDLFTIQNFGFNTSTKELLKIFDEMDYSIFKKKTEMDYKNKRLIPNKKSEIWTGKETNIDLYSNFIYVDVPPKSVKNIRRTCSKLPANTSFEKKTENDLLKKRLSAFVNEKKAELN